MITQLDLFSSRVLAACATCGRTPALYCSQKQGRQFMLICPQGGQPDPCRCTRQAWLADDAELLIESWKEQYGKK